MYTFKETIDLTEFNKLKASLKRNEIPFEEFDLMGGKQLAYPNSKNIKCSVICHHGSYGHEKGLLEIMGLLTKEESQQDNVIGYLTADDVYYRISNDYREEYYSKENCKKREEQAIKIIKDWLVDNYSGKQVLIIPFTKKIIEFDLKYKKDFDKCAKFLYSIFYEWGQIYYYSFIRMWNCCIKTRDFGDIMQFYYRDIIGTGNYIRDYENIEEEKEI
jgi:hypothetical protein